MDGDNKQICGTCKYHIRHIGEDKHKGEFWCSYEDADGYGDFTSHEDKCECWEKDDGI